MNSWVSRLPTALDSNPSMRIGSHAGVITTTPRAHNISLFQTCPVVSVPMRFAEVLILSQSLNGFPVGLVLSQILLIKSATLLLPAVLYPTHTSYTTLY